VEHPYRANQAALGVAAASRARFCQKLGFSAAWVREGKPPLPAGHRSQSELPRSMPRWPA